MPFGWIARIAVGALATVAIVVFVRSSGPAKAGHHSAGIAPAEAASASVTPADVEQRSASVVSAFGRTNAAARTNSGLVVDRPDHEFSLPAIAAAAAMAIDPLAPANLAEDAPLTVESLQIADLPLTTELSQR